MSIDREAYRTVPGPNPFPNLLSSTSWRILYWRRVHELLRWNNSLRRGIKLADLAALEGLGTARVSTIEHAAIARLVTYFYVHGRREPLDPQVVYALVQRAKARGWIKRRAEARCR